MTDQTKEPHSLGCKCAQCEDFRAGRPRPSSKERLFPIKEALDAAAIALPVLFTMCTRSGLKVGAMAADEILGSIKFAQKELAHLMSADETTHDAEDAAKWRALRNCARITAMGCAGLTQPDSVHDNYGHLTLNFWTGIPDGDPGPGYAREWLDKFVAKARRASPKETSDHSDPFKRCQHDLQKPGTTIVVDGTYDAKCMVCTQQWHLPPVKAHSQSVAQARANLGMATGPVLVISPEKAKGEPDKYQNDRLNEEGDFR